MYCLALLGYAPENLLIGNSVFSMGFIGGIASQFRSAIGGEITQVTNMIAEGRRLSLDRFNQELSNGNYAGATGLTSELIFHPGNVEFLTIGSAVSSNNGVNRFTSSSDGQELFCQWDAGYQPINFIFGNVAYSIGLVKGILGEFKQLKKGEVQQYSDIFNQTRNLALDRIITEAKNNGANSVVGIRTTILPVGISPVQEMVMIGTASYNSQINSIAGVVNGVTTSDMTAEETWNVAKLGYAPLKLVLGTSIYSLGLVGGLKAGLKNFVKGEISELTNMIYGAREQSINRLTQQAQEIGADDILGIKTYIYNLGGGLIEFLAIGTAVKKIDGLTTNSQQIPPQAIIRDKTTFINATVFAEANNLQRPQELADNNGQ
jgi:uncharacterized protein YbjQ (UPF0145 family)